MSLLDDVNLNEAEQAKDTSDSLPSSPVRTVESDVYPMTVKLAYLGKSASGALAMHCHFESDTGFEFKESFWIASGDAKGNKTTYTRDGVEYPLPGFTHADHLCRIATGTSLKTSNREEKLVNIYDRDQQKEVPTKAEVFVDLLGKKVQLGIQKVQENKRTQVNGNWVMSNQPRVYNQVDRIFSEEGKTAQEVLAGEDANLKEKWLERNKGQMRDKYDPNKGVDPEAQAPTSPSQPADTSSLFD